MLSFPIMMDKMLLERVSLLQKKVEALEQENIKLKMLLKQAGVDCSSSDDSVPVVEPDSDQGARIRNPEYITEDLVRRYMSYFAGRTDVYAKRYENIKTGAVGYSPQCRNRWDKSICPRNNGRKIHCVECSHQSWISLTYVDILRHLKGEDELHRDVIGLYPLLKNNACRFIVFDFDNHKSDSDIPGLKDEVNSLRKICALNNIPHLVERSRSGKGAHVWIFFSQMIPASKARQFGFALIDKGSESVDLTTLSYYDKLFPTQDNLNDSRALGNLIALPLQGSALKKGNSAFVDDNWNAYERQWHTLLHTGRLSEQDIDFYINQWTGCTDNSNKEDSNNSRDNDVLKPWDIHKDMKACDITGEMDITLADGIYVEKSNLKPLLRNQIRYLAAFSNPEYFRNRSMGYSNWNTPRFINKSDDIGGYIHIPQGLLSGLTENLIRPA